MPIPTEPIGSIPRPTYLLEAMAARAVGRISEDRLRAAEEKALRDTIARFEETNSPEGRLALKLDPSGGLLNSFVDLNNLVADGFTAAEPERIGVHTCPDGDHDSTHRADVDYMMLLRVLSVC